MGVRTYNKTDKTKLAKNFSVYEFSCHGKGCCTETKIDDLLVEHLQKIWDYFSKKTNNSKLKIRVTSGYRCEKHNKSDSVGGVTGSRHTKGQAADIVVEGVAPREVAEYAESIGIKGIGLYETDKDGYFVHIDTRTTKSFWYGQKQEYRSTFKITTDSSYSQKQFIKDIQKAIGAKVDGIAGPETLSKTPTLSSKVNRKHPAVKCVQKRLAALGYREIGSADGVAGPLFTSTVAHFQVDNGIKADGEITAQKKTWKKLLGLN